MKRSRDILFVGLLTLLAGCAKEQRDLPATVTAEGVVTLDGNPVENAAVTFIADSGTHHATAVSKKDGKFALKAFQEKPGAVPGSYKVEVNQTIVSGGESGAGTEGEGGPVTVKFGLPEKYSTITTSGLAHTIPDSGSTDLKIELTTK